MHIFIKEEKYVEEEDEEEGAKGKIDREGTVIRERERERGYGEDSVTEVAMDITELVGGGEVVRRKGSG